MTSTETIAPATRKRTTGHDQHDKKLRGDLFSLTDP